MRTKPLAWRVEVRQIDPETTWQHYATYDDEKAALGMVGRCIGHPLEFRVIPLFSADDVYSQEGKS